MDVPEGAVRAEGSLPAGSGNEGLFRRRERVVVAVALVFSWLTFSIAQYDRMRNFGPTLEQWIRMKLQGLASEGDQYRVAVPYVAHWLDVHLRARPEQTIPWMESLTYGLGLLLLYLQLRWSPRLQSGGHERRLVAVGLFLAAVQFPVLWIFPWERPETLLTMFYLTAVTLMAVHLERMPAWLACVLALVLSVAQGTARSDAPVVAGLAIIIWAATRTSMPAAARVWRAVFGAICGGAGGVTQLYLAHRFPLHPGQTKWTFQLIHNFEPRYGPLHLGSFLTALLPLLLTLYVAWRRRAPMDDADRLVLLVCLIHLPIYMTMGMVNEVRIYVPYLFLASPSIAKIWTGYLLGETAASGERSSPAERSAEAA